MSKEEEKMVTCRGDEKDDKIVMDLPEELILEIMFNLPMIKATQCKCLKKGFNQWISDPKFALEQTRRSKEKIFLHYSFSNGKYLGELSLCPPYSVKYVNIGDDLWKIPYGDSDTVDKERLACPLTSSSCGRLLMQFKDRACLHIFNPVTGEYREIPYSELHEACDVLRGNVSGVGLVDHATNSSFKLVVAVFLEVLQFSIFESENNKWREPNARNSSLVNLNSKFVLYCQPVYLDDRLHWLLENGDVLVFDLNSEQPEIITRPDGADNILDGKRTWFGIDTWLGMAEDYLAYAIAEKERIVIYGFDNVRKLWVTKNIIENPSCNSYRNGRPVFWDGKTLVHLSGMGLKEIYKYEIEGNLWEEIGQLEDWTASTICCHLFVPTLAKVEGGRYLHENVDDPSDQEIVERFAKLQKLLIRSI